MEEDIFDDEDEDNIDDEDEISGMDEEEERIVEKEEGITTPRPVEDFEDYNKKEDIKPNPETKVMITFSEYTDQFNKKCQNGFQDREQAFSELKFLVSWYAGSELSLRDKECFARSIREFQYWMRLWKG
jgi:hypothetical protein